MSAIESLEAAIGCALPLDYREFVLLHHADDESNLFVKYAGDRRDVRCLLDVRCADVSYNVLGTFSLVSDVIPLGTLPIGVDWADNLYLLVCSGESRGSVVWWDHERLPGEHHVEEVSGTFTEFLRALVRGET